MEQARGMEMGRTMNENRCVHGQFLAIAHARPELLAIGPAHTGWTYGELERASRKVALRMRSSGVCCGDVVVIDCDRSAELIVLLLAAMRIGAVFLVLGERWPEAYKESVTAPLQSLHWAAAGAGRTAQSVVQRLLGERLKSYLELALDADTRTDVPLESLPDALECTARPMYLAATSGSTGRPKLVMGNHEPVVHFLDWYIRRFGFGSAERFSLLSGLGYDPMLRDIFTALSSGGSVWIPAPQDLHARFGVGRWLQKEAISVVHTTPSLAALIFDSEAVRSLPDLKVVALGGEPLSWRRAASVARVASGAMIVNFYGTTETPQAVAYHAVRASELKDSPTTPESSGVPLGGPIDDVEVLLLDSQNESCSPAEVGEICIRTRYHSQGYYGDPAMTARAFTVDPTGRSAETLYRTGDLGYRNDNGEVVFVGRKDRQVKCGGNRLQLEEIESVIRQISGARHVVATVENTGEEHSRLVCYVETPQGSQAVQEQIRRAVLSTLPPYMLPSRLICVASLPLTARGKLDLAALARSEISPGTHVSEAAARGTGLHARLVEIWATVLEVPQGELNDDSNFFEVGGNSLLAGRLISSMNEVFKGGFAMTDVFLYPKIRDWINVINAGDSKSGGAAGQDDRSQKRGNRIAAARAARMKA
jgi:amino acid adenylation domain-containing protein